MRQLIIILITTVLYSQSNISGGSALTANINTSPQLIALNNSNTASISGVSALQVNPAGLLSEKYEANFSKLSYFAEIGFYEVGLAIPSVNGTFGVRMKSMDSGEELITTADNIDGDGSTWTYRSNVIDVAYSSKLMNELTYGINMKFIDESVHTVDLTTWAADFGMRYQLNKSVAIAVSAMNIGPSFNYTLSGEEKDKGQTSTSNLSNVYNIGGMYNMTINGDDLISVTSNYQLNEFAPNQFSVGLSYETMQMLKGYVSYAQSSNTDVSSANGMAFGLSLFSEIENMFNLEFTYAYQAWNESNLEASNVFGVQVTF